MPTGESQLGRHGPVHPWITQFRLCGNDFRGRSTEGAHHVDRVAADVHGRAAGQRVVVADVGELRQWHAEGSLHPVQLPQLPRRDEFLDPQCHRVVAVVEGLHHHPVGLRAQFGQLAGLCGVGRERLLAQHVLARLERCPGPPSVQSVRQRVVDGIQLGIGDQRFVAAVHSGDAVFGCEDLGPGHVPGRDGSHLDLVVSPSGEDERHWCDACCTQNSDPYRPAVSRHRADVSSHPWPLGASYEARSFPVIPGHSCLCGHLRQNDPVPSMSIISAVMPCFAR